MTRTILITGATGTVGRHVAAELASRDALTRAGLRAPHTTGDDLAGIDETVEFDFERPETWGAALTDVDSVFLVRPPEVDETDVKRFVDAIDRVGASRIIYLSTLGAERNVLIPHHRIERRIARTSAGYTFLRASFFMQNLLEVHRQDVVDRDEIFVPAGNGSTSFVDARDVGAVAATVLTESAHGRRAYDLTGPESLTYETVANVFAEALNRPITYPNPSIPTFVRRMRDRGHPWRYIALMCGIYTTARLGLADRITDDVHQILGRPPRSLETFVTDYADQFRPESRNTRSRSS